MKFIDYLTHFIICILCNMKFHVCKMFMFQLQYNLLIEHLYQLDNLQKHLLPILRPDNDERKLFSDTLNQILMQV